ncbi:MULTISPECIES: VOC family protein [Chryseobacterium]|uniref:VOC family protein n=1 Tax=Chryseobacterium TaxID=59732 RepID=UPI001BEA08C7|nr:MULTISPECIES: VOC family protein [Chryseobacterium]MBT2619436.1 VOC family protein [Chryseobacterium sp. ISL-6]
MKFDHFALWCNHIELMRKFYLNYFEMESNEKYENQTKRFASYFLSFKNNPSARLELMERPDITENDGTRGMLMGYAHLAISVGNKEKVDSLTKKLQDDGYTVIGEPRTTGDGYYESIVKDPEGNWIEITE